MEGVQPIIFIHIVYITGDDFFSNHYNNESFITWYISGGNIVFARMYSFNPFKPEFTIVIFIHYKPRIAVAILEL